jgi:threonine-phosphate decarboxylase
VSVNPFGPPRAVWAAIRRALPDVVRYPDARGRILAERLAVQHGIDPAQVVVGNGSTDLIHRLAHVLRPRRVAIVEPTFTEYLKASLAVGARIDHWLAEGPDFRPAPFDPGRCDLVWVCNPNNPTGQLWPRGVLASWIAAQPRTRFVIDEAFLPFRPDEKYHTLIPALGQLPNLIVLRSLTKIFSLPGLRLGYALLPQGAVPILGARLGAVPWSVNVLAEAAAIAALGDRAYLARTHAWLESEGPRFVQKLADLEPVPSAVNFVLLRLPNGFTSAHLTQLLARRGIAVRDASNFVGLDERYVRVAVRSRRENDTLLKALDSLLRKGE